jgi:hypothetical protein
MARRDLCARSAEAPAVAEDMLLRLAIPAYARHAQSRWRTNRIATLTSKTPPGKHQLCPRLLAGRYQKNQGDQVSEV